jgi:hypothetical protein
MQKDLIGVNLTFYLGILEEIPPVHSMALVNGKSFVFSLNGNQVEIVPGETVFQSGKSLSVDLMGVIFWFLHQEGSLECIECIVKTLNS